MTAWLVVGAVVVALVVLGAGVLSTRPRSSGVALVSFSAAAAILMTKTLWWVLFEAPGVSTPSRLIVALATVGVAGAWWMGAATWARRTQIPGQRSTPASLVDGQKRRARKPGNR
jgi:hypothetical protein